MIYVSIHLIRTRVNRLHTYYIHDIYIYEYTERMICVSMHAIHTGGD